MGRAQADQEVPSLLPHDQDPRWLPDPIPASFYARAEAPQANRWAMAPTRMPSRTMVAVGAVALAGVLLVGVVGVRLITGRPAAVAQRIQAPGSPSTAPATAPPGQPTPLAAVPTDTPTPTPTVSPTPTPTPKSTPSPTSGTVTVPDRAIQAQPGGSATLLALTAPGTVCEISVGYSPAPQLPPATANTAGKVGWTWPVANRVRPGRYPIQVTCAGASASATITVT